MFIAITPTYLQFLFFMIFHLGSLILFQEKQEYISGLKN